MSRTITRLYDTYDEGVRAVQMLEQAGFAQADISLVGQDQRDQVVAGADETRGGTAAGTGATVGTVVGGGLGLLAGIGALAIPGVGPVVAAGWLIATLTGAGVGAGAGGLIGSLTGAGHTEHDAHVYAEGVRRGGTLVSVRADDARAAEADTLLNGTTSVDLAQRSATYREEGWERYDDTRPIAGRPIAARPTDTRLDEPGAPAGVMPGMGAGTTGPTTTREAAEMARARAATHS